MAGALSTFINSDEWFSSKFICKMTHGSRISIVAIYRRYVSAETPQIQRRHHHKIRSKAINYAVHV